ncbi:MAG: TIGR03936 family radical SAM-associated protein [bacterium]|nr:TIGR03936 family radical SAM-associated protein [bacterium]
MNDSFFVYRVSYEKKGLIRFVSHLDVARMVMRALRLGVNELRFSQGFNPHPNVSFCQALSLGFESDSEYFDFEALGRLDANLLPGKINRNLPKGIRVLRVDELRRGSGVEDPVSCVYEVALEGFSEDIRRRVEQFESCETRPFRKRNGREVNLRETVDEIRLLNEKDNRPGLFLRLSLENQKYINPKSVICELLGYAEKDVLKLRFRRKYFNWRKEYAENINKC